MKFSVTVENVRDLIHSAGVTVGDVAVRMGRSESMTAQKLIGTRPLFLDEVGAIAGSINAEGRITVTEEQVIRLIGKKNIKVRGFAG